MTNHYELIKKYNKKKLITVCLCSYEQYKKGTIETLEHRVDLDEWIEIKPPKENYKNYSHSICDYHLERFYRNKVLRGD